MCYIFMTLKKLKIPPKEKAFKTQVLLSFWQNIGFIIVQKDCIRV